MHRSCEQLGPLGDHAAQAAEQGSPLRGGGGRPPGERRPGRRDGGVDVARGRLGDDPGELLGSRILDLQVTAATRDPTAADVKCIFALDVVHVMLP